MTQISIIIVNYYSADFVLECVRSIYEKTADVSFEIIVVDNASSDNCQEMLCSQYPDVIFVQSEVNLGFGKANNLGARRSSGDILLFLNPDTVLLNYAIECLYKKYIKLDKPGAVGCRLFNSDGSLQKSCVQAQPTWFNQLLDADLLHQIFPKSNLWGASALYENSIEPVEVEVVSGACLMMGKSVFEQIGGFSPEYFMYGEDLDLCFKANQAGFHNYFIPDAIVLHHGGGSTSKSVSSFSNVMMRESVYRLLRKTRGSSYSNCYRAALIGAGVVRMVLLWGLYPVWFTSSRGGEWLASFHKWLGILRWGFGLERWTLQYGSNHENTSYLDESIK